MGNLYLEAELDFNDLLTKVRELYQKDKLFQKYIKEDCAFSKRKLNENQLNFFLEEDLMTYLILNKKIKFRNEYVQGREKWVLLAYPGFPLKSLVYLCQKDPFKLTPKNTNEFYGEYNLDNHKFYDFNNLDLETWNYN